MKNITQALKVVTLALTLSFGISYVYAWTAPTQRPPSGNVSAPINTSATEQYKEGTLGIGGLIRGYANAIFDGNVGIGTTTPNTALTVVGMYRGTSNIRSEGEVSGVVPGSGVGTELGVGGAGVFAYLQGFNRTTPGYAPLHLYGSYMSLQPGGGNVGIGTTAPGAKLEVNGNTLIDGELSGSGTYGVTRIWADTLGSKQSGDPLELQYAVAGDVVVSGTDSNLKVEGTGNSSFAGNVGIGISVPKSKLDVQSTFSVTQANGINTRRYGLVNFAGYGAIGSEWAPKVYSIRTPDIGGNSEMYKYDVTGFSYGIGRPISLTYVGYLYGGAPTVIIQGYSMDNAGVGINTWQNIGYDGHLYLHFGPISQYYNTFTLDYQSGATGETTTHIPSGYSVTLGN